jgi:hypothetical protein
MRLLTRRRVLGAAALFSVGAAAGTVIGVRSHVAAQTATTAADPVVLRDASNQYSLSVQLQTNRADTGSFVFHVNAKGDYVATALVQPGAGPADILSMGTRTTARYYANGGAAPTTVTMHLDGTVTLTDDTALLTVVVDGATYVLRTDHGASSMATTVVQQAVNDIVAQNFTALYGLAPSTITSQMSQAAFVQQFTSQTVPVVVSATLSGSGISTIGADGYSYFAQPVATQVRTLNGTLTTYTATLYLVLEAGQWRVFGTDKPPQL